MEDAQAHKPVGGAAYAVESWHDASPPTVRGCSCLYCVYRLHYDALSVPGGWQHERLVAFQKAGESFCRLFWAAADVPCSLARLLQSCRPDATGSLQGEEPFPILLFYGCRYVFFGNRHGYCHSPLLFCLFSVK